MELDMGIAIPCTAGHVGYLPGILDSIKQGTVLPKCVGVSISESKLRPGGRDFTLPELDYPFELMIVHRPNPSNASENRNAAALAIKDRVAVVSFIDADDLVHPRRMEVIKSTFVNYGMDAVVHDYNCGLRCQPPVWWELGGCEVYRDLVTGPSGFGLQVSKPGARIHHGHVSVRSEVLNELTFREEAEFHWMEDSVFCSDLIRRGFKVAYVDEKLTRYNS